MNMNNLRKLCQKVFQDCRSQDETIIRMVDRMVTGRGGPYLLWKPNSVIPLKWIPTTWENHARDYSKITDRTMRRLCSTIWNQPHEHGYFCCPDSLFRVESTEGNQWHYSENAEGNGNVRWLSHCACSLLLVSSLLNGCTRTCSWYLEGNTLFKLQAVP